MSDGALGDGEELRHLLAELVGRLTGAELRRLFIELAGYLSRDAGGLRIVMAIEALRACGADGADSGTRRSYERWRTGRPRPDEYPSALFISRCFHNRWATALDAAGLAVPVGRRAQQHSARTSGYTAEQVKAAVVLWLREERPSDLSFHVYQAWARAQMRTSTGSALPLTAPTFLRHLGGWAAGIAAAREHLPTAARPRRVSGVRSGYESERLLDHLRQAALQTGLRETLSRRSYDAWAREQPVTSSGAVVARSEAIRRRFGSWDQARRAAGLADLRPD